MEEEVATTQVMEEVEITRTKEVMGKIELKTTTKVRYNAITAKNTSIMFPNGRTHEKKGIKKQI